MKIEIELDSIDYGSVAATLLPVVGAKLSDNGNPLIKMLVAKASDGKFVRNTVNALPQRFKDELLVALLNKNEERMRETVRKLAVSKGMDFHIKSVKASL